MKKTFTQEEFEALTHELIANAMIEGQDRNMSGKALMAFSMTFVIAFGELIEKLFNNGTDTIEITTEKEI